MPSSSVISLEQLEAKMERILLGDPGAERRRLIGVEYERLLLRRDTRQSATLADSRRILAAVLAASGGQPIEEDGVLKGVTGDGFEVSLEPGGQIEVSTPPCRDLIDVDLSIARSDAVLERALAGEDFELVALGHAPVSPADELGLLPRNRYRIMDAQMPSRGGLTRHMMRATAGLQVTLDFRDKDDATRLLALLFRLTPVLAAMTANSRLVDGRDSGFASFRHHVWLHTDRDRSALPDDCLHPNTVLPGYIAWARRARALFLFRDGELSAAPDESFERLVARGAITEGDLGLHMTSMFPFVRPRGHAEVRCMDAVSWPCARAMTALLAAIDYCDVARTEAEALSAGLVTNGSGALWELHEAVARDGLMARAPDGRGMSEYAIELIEIAARALGGGSCRFADPEVLGPLRDVVPLSM